MPLVPAKCTNCGDTVKVDSQKDAAICPSCGSAFIVEKAISNYNISIKADKIEINNDGVTADNLLQLASEDISSGNYAKAANYLARVLERDTSNPLLRPVRIFCNVVASVTINGLTIAKLQEACELAKETYSLLGDGQEQEGKHQYDSIFSQSVFKATLSTFNTFIEHNTKALLKQETWDSTTQQYLQCAKIMDEFISWGQSSGFFSVSPESTLPQERQIQAWVDCLLECLQTVSLCYHDDLSLSPKQAQLCYDIAAKYQSFAKAKELSKRLIPPCRGGEGIHSHRLYDEDNSYSISDQRYYSLAIINGPPPELQNPNSSNSASASASNSDSAAYSFAMAGCISVFLYIAVIPPLVEEARRNNGSGLGMTLQFLVFLVLIAPLAICIIWKINNSYEEKKRFQEYIKLLYPQWKNSPAHGTKTKAKAKEFEAFVIFLEDQAKARIKEMLQ
ncbi:hypothetical protein IJT17_01050 [bacterium]|nr:hypothetical protein [bacterium]